MDEKKQDSDRKPAAYIAGIIANIVAFAIVNALPNWNLRFITSEFPAILWALNLSILTQVAGNAILLFIHPRFLHYLGQVLFGAVSILSIIVTLTVFPFDFSYFAGSVVNTVARVILFIALGGTAIAVITNALKALGSVFGSRETDD